MVFAWPDLAYHFQSPSHPLQRSGVPRAGDVKRLWEVPVVLNSKTAGCRCARGVQTGQSAAPNRFSKKKNTAARKAPLADYRPVIAKGFEIHAAFADKACRWLDHVASVARTILQWLPNKGKLHDYHDEQAICGILIIGKSP